MRRLIPLLLLPLAASLAAVDEPPLPFDDMAPTLGGILEDDYYDPDRFRPELMVRQGLRALEAAEVSIEITWDDGQLELFWFLGKPGGDDIDEDRHRERRDQRKNEENARQHCEGFLPHFSRGGIAVFEALCKERNEGEIKCAFPEYPAEKVG